MQHNNENKYSKVINIAEYTHPIRIRLTQKQLDKIKSSNKSISNYIRDAIDCYEMSVDEIIEKTKLDLIEEIQRDVVGQLDDLQTKVVGQIVGQKLKIDEEFVGRSYNCNTKLNELQEKCTTNQDLKSVNDNEIIDYGLILQILPTLQGLYHSEQELTDEKLAFQAKKIGVSVAVLRKWMINNKELLVDDTLSRQREHCRTTDVKNL